MAKHYSTKKSMAQPRDIENSNISQSSQMNSIGASYYGRGYGKPQNMPTEVEMSEYPQPYRSLETEAYPDTLREIDGDTRYNQGKVESHRSDSMY